MTRFDSWQGKGTFSSAPHSDRLRDPHNLADRYWGLFSSVKMAAVCYSFYSMLPAFSAEVKSVWKFTSTLPCILLCVSTLIGHTLFSLPHITTKLRLIRSPYCQSVCPRNNFWTCFIKLNRPCHWELLWSQTFKFHSSQSIMADIILLRWMHNLHQTTWDCGIFYPDASCKDEKLLIRLFLWKTNTMTVDRSLVLKFMFFMETIYELLYLDILRLVQ